MYSLLMMAALAGGGSDAPAFGGRLFGPTYGACHGVAYVPSYTSACYGSSCYGGSYYSACTGCYGSSCCGYAATSCCGGGGLFAGLLHHSGCCGYAATSCCGYTSSYYYGSCVGSSCCGGCYGSPYYSAYGGCYGSCYGAVPMSPSYAPMHMVPPVIVAPAHPVILGSADPTGDAVVNASRDEPGTNGLLAAAPAQQSAPARLAIELPAKAKLYVDGVVVPGSGTTRQFHTPDLTRDKAYYYELKAEVVIDGKTEVEEKKVVVHAGDSAIEAFPKLLALARKAESPTVIAAK